MFRKTFSHWLKPCLALSLTLQIAACAGNEIIPEIPLGLNPPTLANPVSLAISNSKKRLYLVNSNNRVAWENSSFLVFDITNPLEPQAIFVTNMLNFSGQIILDEARQVAYLPNRASDSEAEETEQLLRINLDEGSPDFLRTDIFESAENPFGAFFNGQDLYVACTANALRYDVDMLTGYTSVDLDVTTNEGDEIDADETRELALSPSGNNLFVTNRVDQMLILNAAEITKPTQSGAVDLGESAVDYIVTGTNSTRGTTRDSQFIYIVDGAPASLKIMTDQDLVPVDGDPVEISTATLQVASIPVGEDPSEVIVDEAKRRAYVSNTGSADVSIIDLDALKEIARISVSTLPEPQNEDEEDDIDEEDEDQPFGMALGNIDGKDYLYVAHFGTNLVSIIDVEQLKVVGRF